MKYEAKIELIADIVVSVVIGALFACCAHLTGHNPLKFFLGFQGGWWATSAIRALVKKENRKKEHSYN